MKLVIKFLFLIISFSLLGSPSFAQTKKDSLKHWSVGIAFSPGFYSFRWFPDEENNGLPLQEFEGHNYGKLSKGSSNSLGISFSYCLKRKFVFQFALFNTIEKIKYLATNIHVSSGSSWGGIRIYLYEQNYFESSFSFKYNYLINKKSKAFVSLGLNSGFLYKEYLEKYNTNPMVLIRTNKIFKFNRIVPEFKYGFVFCTHKPLSYLISGNIDFLPIYQKRNTYEYTNGIKLSLSFGIHYNF